MREMMLITNFVLAEKSKMENDLTNRKDESFYTWTECIYVSVVDLRVVKG